MSGAATAGRDPGSVQWLLEGKLHPPRARPDALVRTRLLERLDASSAAALTLVSAPVGFGKTMLVDSWCAGHEGAVAWVSLDSADDDPVRFWSYVAAALARVRQGLGRAAQHDLRSPGVPPELVAEDVIRALNAHDAPLAIVLDDLHAVSNPDCLGSLAYALERLPAHTRVIAATRHDPALPVARLRAHAALAEIRAGELAFTIDEARELLVERERLPLDDDDVRALVERTEGWPAGLYLAALWLRGLDDLKAGVAAFGGDHRHIADYLTSEVLGMLDDDSRRFLLETATLRTFSAALCDTVLGRSDSSARIREIERTNCFLVALDDSGGWFRYHHLFGELLERELSRREPATSARIHLGASGWLHKDGRVDEALEHAAAARSHAVVLGLLSAEYMALLRSGRLATLLLWCGRVPQEALLEHPEIAISAVYAAGLLGQPAHVRHRFTALAERARARYPDRWTSYEEASLGVARTTWIESSLREAIAVARTTLPLAREEAEVGVGALASLAMSSFLAGEHADARALAQEALHRPEAVDRVHGFVGALAVLSLVETDEGGAKLGEQRAHEAIRAAQAAEVDEAASCGLARVALAAALAEQGRLRWAEQEAVHGERLRRQPDPELGHLHALLVLADIRVRRGDLNRARADLAEARRRLDTVGDAGILPSLADAVERSVDEASTQATLSVEAPTAAELNVLRLFATDLSQREIGDRLYISRNTVKTHTRALYRKLGVSSREAAVERARGLGLLDGDALD